MHAKTRSLFELFTIGCLALMLGCSDKQPDTPMIAVINNDLTLLKRLEKEGMDLNMQDPGHFNWTPLMAAIYFEHTNMAAYLISRGVDVSRRDGTGQTALELAIVSDDTNTVSLMLPKGRSVMLTNENWPLVCSLVDAGKHPAQWRALLAGFPRMTATVTNNAASVQPKK